MRMGMWILLFLGIASVALAAPKKQPPPPPEACTDEAAMVADYSKSLTDLIDTVKKESLQDFQRTFHRKTTLTKLNLFPTMLDGAIACLDKAAQNPDAPKAQVDAYKEKRESYAKLKDAVTRARDSLKGIEIDREAKAVIEKMELPH